MKILILPILLSFNLTVVLSQSLSTDIFLVNLELKDNKFSCSKPLNITSHDGYDNQPEFSPDGERILFVSMPDTIQTDIFEYVIADSTSKQLTKTSESEYSPRFSPNPDQISFVRVDGNKSQRLYQSAIDFADPEVLIHGIDSVGYYMWLNDSTIALANLNNGLELIIYDLFQGQYIIYDKAIGRCLLRVPGSADLIYTKRSADKVTLFRYSAETGTTISFCEGLDGVEDYAFTPDGMLMAGQNGKLFVCQPMKDQSWKEIADFTESAGSFYRLVVSPDAKHIALVTYKGKRP